MLQLQIAFIRFMSLFFDLKYLVHIYICQDSEDDEHEETEEEFLDRYAKVAAELEDDIVEEGDLEDEEHRLDLGKS